MKRRCFLMGFFWSLLLFQISFFRGQSVWREGRCCGEQVGGRRARQSSGARARPVAGAGRGEVPGMPRWAAATRVPELSGEPRTAAWGQKAALGGRAGAGVGEL